MAQGILVVESRPSPGQEDDYNAWYTGTHIPEMLAVTGFVAAHRYRLRGQPGDAGPTYLTIYEIEADDITAPVEAMRSRAGRSTSASPALQTDPPPVVRLFDAV